LLRRPIRGCRRSYTNRKRGGFVVRISRRGGFVIPIWPRGGFVVRILPRGGAVGTPAGANAAAVSITRVACCAARFAAAAAPTRIANAVVLWFGFRGAVVL
jgi:hypothetical protein